MTDEFRDMRGNAFPPGEPGGMYVGSLKVGQVVFDHAGREVTVYDQNDGSTTIRRAGRTKTVEGKTFVQPEIIAISRESVVYLRKGGAPL